MNWPAFETQVSGKWVLTGEHAVLRGVTAIALPHPEFGLRLSFRPRSAGEEKLSVDPASAQGVIDEILAAINQEQKTQDRAFILPAGQLVIESSIPIGAGLGSSAALCVAMSRWMAPKLGLNMTSALQDFATRLEHRFHGKSSGMDVAVIAAGEAISFVMPTVEGGKPGVTALGVRKLPRFSFHDTGIRTRTSDCVRKVELLRQRDLKRGHELDEQMSAASKLAHEGLVLFDSSGSAEALDMIARSMRQAQECFASWELVPAEVQRLHDALIAQGALAAKITGAGGGGMMVALWPN